jgi:DNA-binding CsgD family transcriptional regulator
MGASGLWNKSRVAGMLGLLSRLHTSGADAVARRRMWIDGMCALVAAPVGVLVLHEITTKRSLGKLADADAVSGDGHIVDALPHELLAGEHADPAARRLAQKVLRRRTDAIVTHRRLELVDDQDWYAHDHVTNVRQPLGLDDTIYSAGRVDDRRIACLALLRPWGERKTFAKADCDMVNVMHGQCDWVYRRAVPPTSLQELHLSPREEQTLWKLLDGRSEKQIAREMRLSPNTVHHYVKSIYRRLGVSSRGELSARWLERDKKL